MKAAVYFDPGEIKAAYVADAEKARRNVMAAPE